MFEKSKAHGQLGDLHGVGGGTLAHLIAAAPEVQAVVAGKVVPDAAHEHDVLIGGIQRHGILLVLEIVHQAAACRLGDGGLGVGHADLMLAFT